MNSNTAVYVPLTIDDIPQLKQYYKAITAYIDGPDFGALPNDKKNRVVMEQHTINKRLDKISSEPLISY